MDLRQRHEILPLVHPRRGMAWRSLRVEVEWITGEAKVVEGWQHLSYGNRWGRHVCREGGSAEIILLLIWSHTYQRVIGPPIERPSMLEMPAGKLINRFLDKLMPDRFSPEPLGV